MVRHERVIEIVQRADTRETVRVELVKLLAEYREYDAALKKLPVDNVIPDELHASLNEAVGTLGLLNTLDERLAKRD